MAARKTIARLEGHKSGGIGFGYNHAGDLLASACWDRVLRLWDPRTGQQVFHTPAGFSTYRFSSDDQLLAAGIEGDKIRIWEVAAASGYRTLVRESVESQGYYHISAIHPDGRLLAVGMADGFDMWDLFTGKHLASIKLPTQNNNLLFDPSGELLTSGYDALRRWPIQAEPASGVMRVGPPITEPVPAPGNHIAHSREGRVLASAQLNNGGLVLHGDHPVALGPHADVRCIAVSPDGRWVATGSHWGTKVKVWHAQSGKLEKELPVETGSMVVFSPNGKWLATTGDGLRLWAVNSWDEGPHIGGGTSFTPVAFTNDGKLLAVETGNGVVRLVNPDTGREYARLEDPHQDRAGAMTFSRDGTQLVTTSNDSHSIHVLDLRTIREQLTKMGLDWELPAYGPPKSDNGQPLRVELELGAPLQADHHRQQAVGYLSSSQWDMAVTAFSKAIELKPDLWAAFEGRRSAYARLGLWDKIIDEYAEAIEVHPNDAGFANYLAWLLAMCPDPKFRDPKRAVELGKKAVQLSPKNGDFWISLGAAHHRAGNWKPALEALEKAMPLRNGGDCADWFFLAMVHWQLGDQAQARQWYDKADQWMATHHHPEWPALRAEAAELLK